MTPPLTVNDRIHGCLFGGAIGDALGYQVEFHSWQRIQQDWGPEGVTKMTVNRISDDTQMTLFTAEGLLDARPGTEIDEVRQAYLRWFDTQTSYLPPNGSRGLAAESWLYERRAPGNACMSGLREGGGPGVNPDSKGCGTVMRSAPFGLLGHSPTRAYELADRCSAITHGHSTAGESAGAFAMITAYLLQGTPVREAVSAALLYLRRTLDRSETGDALQGAFERAGNVPVRPNSCAPLGEGWVAEEALAIAVYCLLGTADVREALIASVSHSGDSDSTGAICGNLLGAAYGYDALPREWATQVEGRATIDTMARHISAAR